MKKKYLTTFKFAILLLVSSCSDDLKFTLPKTEPLLAVQSFIDPDNDFELIVTMARPLQESTIQLNPDCQVDLYENDIFITKLKLDTSFYNQGEYEKRLLKYTANSGLMFNDGKVYQVEINYPGFDKITAIAIKPESVKIKNISWRRFTGEMPNWYYNTPWKQYTDDAGQIKRDTSLIEFTITIDDPNEISNYYRIGVNLITRTNPLYFYDRRLQYASSEYPDPCFMKFIYHTEHPIYSGWENPTTYEILWNDYIFNGEEHSIKILVPTSTVIPAGTKYIISLYSISEDYYKYMVDRWKYSKTENDPFAEPVKLFSNISNGCGIVAFSSLDIDSVVFSKSK